ncbi:Uncharacterised protein [Mycobacteroides abscessus subsp. abscessus]|nr:Uncharacterised protein [Mycobacteroides abscessus subsp. abscessus]
MISVVIVIPSCAPESWNDSVLCARCTMRERRSPRVATSDSTADRSSAVRENSAATKIAVPSVSAMKPIRLATMISACTCHLRGETERPVPVAQAIPP